MPELPDLQAFSQNLEKKLKGKIVKTFFLVVKSKSKATEANYKNSIEKQIVSAVYREGKELRIQFSNGTILGMHLMLHGELNYFEGKNDKKNPILELLFTDDSGLALSDWQQAARPSLNPLASDVPDALDKKMDVKYLKSILNSRARIKNILINQKSIRGIGNAYADEILWEAKISPFSPGNKIPEVHIKALAKSITSVLVAAEKQILKSNPGIISGELRDFMKIHNAKKTISPKGAEIKHEVIGGRKTYYTDEQKMF
ncbi:MAG: DNA-formamidopyrimidine glycosylase family protein [Flavitalea sp.]